MVDSLLLVPAFSLLVIVFSMAINVAPSEAAAYDRAAICPVSNCSDAGPLIKFPFRLKDHPLDCGHPEFEVSCLKSKTMIQLSSSSGLFAIQSVDYDRQTFNVYDDEEGCLPRRLLNFTISTTSLFEPIPSQAIPTSDPRMVYVISGMYNNRFNCADYNIRPSYPYDYDPYSYGMYRPQLEKFTLLNCSTTQTLNTGSSYIPLPITCLSVGHHQVLAVSPSASVTELPFRTCGTLKQLYLPLRRVDDGDQCEPDNVLLLKWKFKSYFPQCRNCTEGTGSCEFNDTSNRMECHPYPIVREPPQALPFPKGPKPKGFLSTRRSIIVGASLASFVLISAMAAVAVFFYVKQSKRKQEKENQLKVERFLKDHKSHVPTRYSYANIKKMTNGFKKKLGEGSFGSVYSGELPTNGVLVAVKVLSDSKGNGEDFVNEVGTIGRIHHVNVVRLLGFSAEGGKRALIYELMQNGSLENFITFKDQSNNTSFDWQKLHNIVNGTAKGIEYLHQGCDRMILHFDIKPHNILLDHDFNPKISDFGLAKLCSKEDSIISMTAARGTVGYIAPEVFNGNFGSVSHKSDVYSFGMLVLEIVGSRKQPALTSGTSDVYFPELVYNCLVQGQALDLKLDTDEDAQIAKKLVTVALWCIQWYPVNRPSMKAVVRMLEGGLENLMMPPNPFASTSTQTDQPRTTLSS
ncbi:rust resistance kinase Lr10-like [Pyrus communis]|uniref:rust resistance kinase Lr10-like n=1 Tax=Pyrus communis TaxID=23211 RepID=UPI0035C23744